MQSDKKFRKDKKEKVTDVMEYAKDYIASVGDKNNAYTKALNHAKAALAGPLPDQETANFWNNVAGHINKY